jgi:hypothetical protein
VIAFIINKDTLGEQLILEAWSVERDIILCAEHLLYR